MYSRLYTHVLNHHSAIDHCSSFHHIYTDSSIFGLVASSFESYTPNTVLPILLHQLSLLLHSYSSIHPSELSRAKNQLMSSLVMSLESRSVEVEDLGRQVLVHGRKIGIEEMLEKIEKVTSDDVRRVARKVFGDEMNGEPSILVMGKEDVGDWKKMFRKYGVGKL
jgi:processing peptidase subunit alpha